MSSSPDLPSQDSATEQPRAAEAAPAAPTTKKIQILGPFNSGSSFVEHLFRINNLDLTDLHFQQTLFKHYPPALVMHLVDRLQLRCDDVLFVAPVRHPGVWIDAMQRNRYELLFDEFDEPCRLDASVARNFYKTYEQHLLEIGLSKDEIDGFFRFDTVFEFWEASYRGYLELGKRLSVTVVRYEDILADTIPAITRLRSQMGLPAAKEVVIPLSPSKDHGDALGYVHAREKLAKTRADPDLLPHDRLIKDKIDSDLLKALNYL